MREKSRLVQKNLLYNSGTKVITLVLGIIIPRLLIVSYGSEVNGLLATVTQIFTYLALLEAGIGNSTVNALYKPIEKSDVREINEIVSEAKTYFRKVSLVYGIGIVVFAVVYPVFTNSTVSKMMIVSIILLQGGANFINYYFTAVYNQLLAADGRKYITENFTFVAYVSNSLIKIVLIYLGFSVIIVQLGYFLVSIVRAPFTVFYCKRKYPWLRSHKTNTVSRLHARKAFIIHEASNTVFNNTDVFIISTFCSLAMASVYTVYNLVYASLTGLLSTANASLSFIMGQNQYKGEKILEKTYDIYRTLYTCVTFVVFTLAYLLIPSFITLYTRGVNDINYFVPGLAMLFTIINLSSGVRATGALLITVSGHADATKNRSIIEAVINLGSSLVLVNICGIKGVLYGTILALLYRANDIIIYANHKVLKRSAKKEYISIASFTAIFIVIALFSRFHGLPINGVGSFVVFGFICSFVVSILYGLLAVASEPYIKSYIADRVTALIRK